MKFFKLLLISFLPLCFVSCHSSKRVVKINYNSEKRRFKELMEWYDFFVQEKRISFNFLPEALDLQKSNIPYFTEQEIIEYFTKSKSSSELLELNNYIETVHSKESENIISYFEYQRKLWKPADVTKELNRTVYYYYGISEERIFKDFYKFPKELSAINQKVFDKENKIPSEFQDLLFSNKFKDTSNLIVPVNFTNYINELLEELKRSIKPYITVEEFNKIRDIKVSTEPKSNSLLWFSNNIDEQKIFISPVILRAVYIVTFNYNFRNLIATKNSYQKGNYISFSLFSVGQQMDFEDYYDENRAFVKIFLTQLSFMLNHELAHIYLGENKTPEFNESKCDCYSLLLYDKINLIGSKRLGIYKDLLEASINKNRPDLWGIENTDKLKARIKFVDNLLEAGTNKKFCDSTFQK